MRLLRKAVLGDRPGPGLPALRAVEANPFRLLAEMPLPIYITTSHHQFLEYALAQTQNKRPVSEIFYWGDHLDKHSVSLRQEHPTGSHPLSNRWCIICTAWISIRSRWR